MLYKVGFEFHDKLLLHAKNPNAPRGKEKSSPAVPDAEPCMDMSESGSEIAARLKKAEVDSLCASWTTSEGSAASGLVTESEDSYDMRNVTTTTPAATIPAATNPVVTTIPNTTSNAPNTRTTPSTSNSSSSTISAVSAVPSTFSTGTDSSLDDSTTSSQYQRTMQEMNRQRLEAIERDRQASKRAVLVPKKK